MSKKILYVLIGVLLVVNTACSTMETTGGNTNSAPNSSNANPPPGFSTSPLPMSNSSTPGIPAPNSDNMNSLQRGATPIPGIPDQKDLGKPLPKGPTPIPGIPDEVIQNKPTTNSNGNSKTQQKPPQTESNANNNPMNKPRAVRKP